MVRMDPLNFVLFFVFVFVFVLFCFVLFFFLKKLDLVDGN